MQGRKAIFQGPARNAGEGLPSRRLAAKAGAAGLSNLLAVSLQRLVNVPCRLSGAGELEGNPASQGTAGLANYAPSKMGY